MHCIGPASDIVCDTVSRIFFMTLYRIFYSKKGYKVGFKNDVSKQLFMEEILNFWIFMWNMTKMKLLIYVVI